MSREREQWVDIGKGFAIVLVVLGHMFRGFTSANMYNNYTEYFRWIDFTIYSFHMPLFFMLSGYLYSKSSNITNIEQYKNMIVKKLLNLGVPYIVFSVLQTLITIILSSKTNNSLNFYDLMLIPIKPIAQFWFLYTLIAIFILVPLIELILKNDNIVFLLFLAFKFSGLFMHTGIKFFDNFLIWGFYFYCGKILLNNFKSLLKSKFSMIFSILIYIILNIYVFKMNNSNNLIINNIIDIILAISGCIFSFGIIRIITKGILSKYINFIGRKSFYIYLLHIIFCSGIRIVLVKLFKVDNFFIHTILGLLLGINVPILIAYWGENKVLIDFCFNPYKYVFQNKRILKDKTIRYSK